MTPAYVATPESSGGEAVYAEEIMFETANVAIVPLVSVPAVKVTVNTLDATRAVATGVLAKPVNPKT